MNVLIVLGHPRTDSLCGALATEYREGAKEADVDVREIAVADLEFDPDVRISSPEDQRMEYDLREARRRIEWADHLAFVYPNWWGTMPARLKGFFDRVFTPGFAFEFHEDGDDEEKRELLDDKTAELIVTMDVPPLVYRLIYRQPGNHAVKRATLGYAGIRTTRVTNLGSVKESTDEERNEWLTTVRRLGRRLESGPESRKSRTKRAAATWLKALRLQFYPMTGVAYTVGALAAIGSSDVLAAALYWVGLAFLFSLEAATVFTNEYFDYETDRRNEFAGPFTGGSRVLVDDDLAFDDLRSGIAVALVLTAAFGLLVLATTAGSTLATAAIVIALATLALGYTTPPLQFAYRTLGELDVAATHSVAAVLFGFVVLGGAWRDPAPWLLGLPLFLGTIPSIALAGVPDYAADRAAGKRTIAVRFGIRGAAVVAGATALLAAGIALLWQYFGVVSDAYGPIALLCVPHAILLVRLVVTRLQRRATPKRIDGLMVASLSYVLWFGVVPLIGLL